MFFKSHCRHVQMYEHKARSIPLWRDAFEYFTSPEDRGIKNTVRLPCFPQRFPPFARKQAEDRSGQYFVWRFALGVILYRGPSIRATHLSLLPLLLTSLILPLSALYCPAERPPGIATTKHALKPPLVPSHRDQRYYPTIILFATYRVQFRVDTRRKVIGTDSRYAIDGRMCRFKHASICFPINRDDCAHNLIGVA